MHEDLVKLCSDKLAQSKFTQLYGEKPEDKVKALKWEYQRLAFFLAWDVASRVAKEIVQEKYRLFLSDAYVDETMYGKCGKYVSCIYLEEFRA